ncbi:MAG: hypothetical protein IT432_14980 [Phycisphaerales bacterium]|nr:hypothetical protein [Phycisphaerales bacterium]
MAKDPIKRVGIDPSSPWVRVSTFDSTELPAGVPLVYFLRTTDGSGAVLPVTTKNGKVDSAGILYIGEGEDAADRLRKLIESFQRGRGGRDAHGVPSKYFDDRYDSKYPFEGLEFRWTRLRSPPKVLPTGSEIERTLAPTLTPGQPTDEKVMARVVERGEIANHKHRVGDLPPFNAKGGYHTYKAPMPAAAPPTDGDVELLDPDSAEAKEMDPRNKMKPGSL